MPRFHLRIARCLVAWTAVTVGAGFFMFVQPAAAQDPPRPSGQQTRPAPDFLFRRPKGTLGIRGSWIFARAGSDLYDFVEDQLTIDKGDFNAPAFAADLGIGLTSRIDVVGGFQFSRVTIASEYRHLVDNNFQPITQQTGLKAIDLSGSVRFALAPRGREVSRFVWVPRRVSPYVGAGAGAAWYEFEQSGDFVDFVDSTVFTDFFRSTGWTPSVHVLGGVDVHLYKRLFATFEGRYLWASAELGRDFVDFDPIDLSGFRLAAGINFVY